MEWAEMASKFYLVSDALSGWVWIASLTVAPELSIYADVNISGCSSRKHCARTVGQRSIEMTGKRCSIPGGPTLPPAIHVRRKR